MEKDQALTRAELEQLRALLREAHKGPFTVETAPGRSYWARLLPGASKRIVCPPDPDSLIAKLTGFGPCDVAALPGPEVRPNAEMLALAATLAPKMLAALQAAQELAAASQFLVESVVRVLEEPVSADLHPRAMGTIAALSRLSGVLELEPKG